MLKYIPNALTISRLLLLIPFLMCLAKQRYTAAFYIFIVAGLTDGLDGILARHFQWQTQLGSFIDPMADKLLITSSFISLALMGQLPWWLVFLVILRDITIALGVLSWFWLIRKKIDFSPTLLSKLNTVLQLALVTLCLFSLAFFKFPDLFIHSLIIVTALTTMGSYIDYVWTWGKRAYLYSRFVP